MFSSTNSGPNRVLPAAAAPVRNAWAVGPRAQNAFSAAVFGRTVHPGGELPAPGALRCAGTDSGHQPHATGPVPDIVEHDALQMRQQPGNKITCR